MNFGLRGARAIVCSRAESDASLRGSRKRPRINRASAACAGLTKNSVLKSRRCSFHRTPLSENGVRESTVRSSQENGPSAGLGRRGRHFAPDANSGRHPVRKKVRSSHLVPPMAAQTSSGPGAAIEVERFSKPQRALGAARDAVSGSYKRLSRALPIDLTSRLRLDGGRSGGIRTCVIWESRRSAPRWAAARLPRQILRPPTSHRFRARAKQRSAF